MSPQILKTQDSQQSALSKFAHSSAFGRPQTETDLKTQVSQSVIAINIHKCLFFFSLYTKGSWQRRRSPSNTLAAHLRDVSSVSAPQAVRTRQRGRAECRLAPQRAPSPGSGGRGAIRCLQPLQCPAWHQKLLLHHGHLPGLTMPSGSLPPTWRCCWVPSSACFFPMF